jgi:hypothetical protein
MITGVMFSACSNNTPSKSTSTTALLEDQKDIQQQGTPTDISRALSAEILRQFKDLHVSIADEKVKVGDSLFLEANITNKTDHGEVIVLELNIVASHPRVFAGGISDFTAGIGTSDTMAIRTGVHNYVSGVFATILHSLTNEHKPALDFRINKELWHPIAGPLQVQGAFSEDTTADEHHIFKLLKPVLVNKLANSKDTILHWVKVYVSRQEDGSITEECEYDNNPMPEGDALLKKYAASWNVKAFAGEKQFFMLKLCGQHK